MRAMNLALLGPIAAVTARLLRSTARHAVETVEEREAMARMFGQHVSPEVVDRLLQGPRGDDTETRFVCLMFLDIRDFTALSQTLAAAEVVALLNQLFEFMIEEIDRRNGIINKFLGDGFLAVFGAPLSDGDDVPNAVLAAEAILARLDEEIAAGRVPPIRLGIGLHAGAAITGSVGSPLRREYTIVGDAVNLASRIEGLNRALGSRLLVSQAVWDRLGRERSGVTVHERMAIRGRTDPETLYQLG
jgi:adenylate cyclase